MIQHLVRLTNIGLPWCESSQNKKSGWRLKKSRRNIRQLSFLIGMTQFFAQVSLIHQVFIKTNRYLEQFFSTSKYLKKLLTKCSSCLSFMAKLSLSLMLLMVGLNIRVINSFQSVFHCYKKSQSSLPELNMKPSSLVTFPSGKSTLSSILLLISMMVTWKTL